MIKEAPKRFSFENLPILQNYQKFEIKRVGISMLIFLTSVNNKKLIRIKETNYFLGKCPFKLFCEFNPVLPSLRLRNLHTKNRPSLIFKEKKFLKK